MMGYTASKYGRAKTFCPFPFGSDQRRFWIEGWEAQYYGEW